MKEMTNWWEDRILRTRRAEDSAGYAVVPGHVNKTIRADRGPAGKDPDLHHYDMVYRKMDWQ